MKIVIRKETEPTPSMIHDLLVDSESWDWVKDNIESITEGTKGEIIIEFKKDKALSVNATKSLKEFVDHHHLKQS